MHFTPYVVTQVYTNHRQRVASLTLSPAPLRVVVPRPPYSPALRLRHVSATLYHPPSPAPVSLRPLAVISVAPSQSPRLRSRAVSPHPLACASPVLLSHSFVEWCGVAFPFNVCFARLVLLLLFVFVFVSFYVVVVWWLLVAVVVAAVSSSGHLCTHARAHHPPTSI